MGIWWTRDNSALILERLLKRGAEDRKVVEIGRFVFGGGIDIGTRNKRMLTLE